MSPNRPANANARTDRRAIAALFAVFALLVQALTPGAAMAARSDGGILICSSSGMQVVNADGKPLAPHKGFDGMPCQDCLAIAMAAVAPPVLDIQTIAYQAAPVEHAPAARPIQPRARAPPRPPGQGPPTA